MGRQVGHKGVVWQVMTHVTKEPQEMQGQGGSGEASGAAKGTYRYTQQITWRKAASQRCRYLGQKLIAGGGRWRKRVLGRGKSKYEALMRKHLGNAHGRAGMRPTWLEQCLSRRVTG